jgi:ABC-type nitrate/sulfonate/bicarbonate transport system permease component
LRILAYVVVAGAVLALWIAVTALGSVNPVLLPPPQDAWEALRALLEEPRAVLDTVAATLTTVLLAFAIAAPAGVTMGVAIGSSRLLRDAYEPLVANLNTVPVITLYPLLVGMFGVTSTPRVVLGVLAAVLPIAIASLWAARSVDATLVAAGRAMGARGWTLSRSVVIPGVMPAILGGLRTGMSLAIVSIIAGEYIASTSGIGYELAETSQSFRTPELFAWLIVTLAFVAVVNGCMSALEGIIERRVRR